jgi:isocitrate lyase
MDYPGEFAFIIEECLVWCVVTYSCIQMKKIISEIHNAVREQYPNRLFGYGYSNTYDWEGNGFSLQDIKEFPSRMAKHGAVFQIQPTWAIQGISHYTDQCAQILHRDGITGLL